MQLQHQERGRGSVRAARARDLPAPQQQDLPVRPREEVELHVEGVSARALDRQVRLEALVGGAQHDSSREKQRRTEVRYELVLTPPTSDLVADEVGLAQQQDP